jgi:hypothetical protein
MKIIGVNMKILPRLCVAAIIITTASWAGAGETGGKTLDEARLGVERSSLTKEAKREILTKADRAVKAGIPPEDATIIITRGLRQGADSKIIAGFLETTTRVKEQNLPVRLVLDRIEQGLSKGVPAGRISGVVQRLAESLASALTIVDTVIRDGTKPARPGGREEAIETVARALEKSIPEDTVMRTGTKVREQKGSLSLFDKATDTMTYFVGNGMPVGKASQLVHTAMDRGYSEKDMEKMEKNMFDDLKKGRSMDDVAAGMENRMNRDDMREERGRTGGEQMRGPGAGMGGPRR